jgi:hypothetical protein
MTKVVKINKPTKGKISDRKPKQKRDGVTGRSWKRVSKAVKMAILNLDVTNPELSDKAFIKRLELSLCAKRVKEIRQGRHECCWCPEYYTGRPPFNEEMAMRLLDAKDCHPKWPIWKLRIVAYFPYSGAYASDVLNHRFEKLKLNMEFEGKIKKGAN